jgi:vacuolar iron transporter family protein
MMMAVGARAIVEWFRPFVYEASDGILTSAGITEGLAGADVGTGVLVFGAAAGLVAGGIAMAFTEYSKVAAERDEQLAELADERMQLQTSPEAELEELTQLYVSRGLTLELARQVATELTAHDALRAHAEAEHGITSVTLAVPLRAAVASGASFAIGSVLPLLSMILISGPARPLVTFIVVLLGLALTGWFAARLSGVHPALPIARTAGTGIVAMALTYLAGRLIHP